MSKTLAAIAAFFCLNAISAQEKKQETKPYKFEKITAADFKINADQLDSSADAVVIADVGNTSFEGNTKSSISLVYNRHERIKILNKNGLDAATVHIHLYFSNDAEEKLDKVKAVTYNLENDAVVENKLDAASIFKDKLSKHLNVRKFTMPAAKAGSIIDIEYTIISDFIFNLQPWNFQGTYPRLWSEYTVDMPDFYNYVVLFQGYQQFYDRTVKNNYRDFNVLIQNGAERSESYRFNSNITSTRWMMKNVPAMKPEAFTTSIGNHISKLEFQLSQIQYPDNQPIVMMPSWFKVSERLMKDEEFGANLFDANGWLTEDLKKITAGTKNNLEKAQKIFAWVRDNFTCTDYRAYYMSSSPKNTFKNKSGNIADVNLLLTAMLNHEKITALPVILSTRENGATHTFYPLMDRFNYVVCEAEIDGQKYYLDAGVPRLGFGKLDASCYNGHARVIGKELAAATYFMADSLKESKISSVVIANDEKGKWSGNFSSQLGYYESFDIRNRIKKSGKDEFIKKIKSQLPSEIEMGNVELDSLDQYDYPITIKYDFDPTANNEDVIYFNPMMSEAYKENIFKAAQRIYPVEMPYTMDEKFFANIDPPKGYEIDEVPKSVRVNLNDDDGFFEYLISKKDGVVMMRSRIVINKANFSTEDYQPLRDFFAYIVKKQGEQVVFKKIK